MATYNRYATDCDLDSEVIADAQRHLTDLTTAITDYRTGKITFGQLTYELKRIGGAIEEVGQHADAIRPSTDDQDTYLPVDHAMRQMDSDEPSIKQLTAGQKYE